MARFKRGATPKLNDVIIKQIAEAIRNGVTVEKAARESGISKDTLYRWLDSFEGRYSEPLMADFKREVGAAKEEVRLINLGLHRNVEKSF